MSGAALIAPFVTAGGQEDTEYLIIGIHIEGIK